MLLLTIFSQLSTLTMKNIFFVIRQVLMRGWKQIGKGILKFCHENLEDVG
jgi:hypothetical protein